MHMQPFNGKQFSRKCIPYGKSILSIFVYYKRHSIASQQQKPYCQKANFANLNPQVNQNIQLNIPHVRNVTSEYPINEKNVFVLLNCEERKIKTLLDTGPQINLIKKSFVKGMELHNENETDIRGINGESS